MSNSPITKTLGKVIIAAAWADGQIQKEEKDCLKDLLFQLPELGNDGWLELDALMEAPVSPADRRKFVRELKKLLKTEEERSFAFYALDRVIDADGVVTDGEKQTVRSMKAALWDVSVKTVEKMEVLLREPLQKRTAANTEKLRQVYEIESMIHERVGDMQKGRFAINMVEEELRKLCLAGILMARVVRADGVIDDNEVAETVRFLKEKWELTGEEAHFVIMVSLSDKVNDLDLIRICRWFYELTNEEERIQFLDVLFQVGMEDGELTEDEIHEVLNITANLKLEQAHFETAFNRVLNTA